MNEASDRRAAVQRQPEAATWRAMSSGLFMQVEHAAYLALGVLLWITAIVALAGAAAVLWGGLSDWAGTETTFLVIDRLLFVLMLIEILHTVRVSVRSGSLVCEPFLVVGLIASIRRILVITLQSSQQTQKGNWTDNMEKVFRASMVELMVLGLLIVVMVVSIYMLRRAGHGGSPAGTSDPPEQPT